MSFSLKSDSWRLPSDEVTMVKLDSQKKDFKIIDDSIFTNVLTIVLYNHQDLRQIRELSRPLSESNEYQVHYFALVRNEKYTDKEINLVVPLVYYNYPQEVSGATVDFNMNEVTEAAKQLLKLAQMKFQIVKKELEILDSILPNGDISYKLTFYNNIHKHP